MSIMLFSHFTFDLYLGIGSQTLIFQSQSDFIEYLSFYFSFWFNIISIIIDFFPLVCDLCTICERINCISRRFDYETWVKGLHTDLTDFRFLYTFSFDPFHILHGNRRTNRFINQILLVIIIGLIQNHGQESR